MLCDIRNYKSNMSFGFGASDCIYCVKLAHKVWKNCQGAPEDFRAVFTEVAVLELVLTKKTVDERKLSQDNKMI